MASAPNFPAQVVRRVVIAGGGTAGWMVAACLSKTMGRLLDIQLIESDEIGTVGVGEATIPTLLTFHQLLGINEQEFMRATQATFKLGIQFENWRAQGKDYFHAFGSTGKDHWTAGFQHFWLKGQARGLAQGYGAYCLELRAAEAGCFAHLPRSGLNYAYHMDATRYAAYLRKMSLAHGVKRLEGKIVEVLGELENGQIKGLRLASGAVIEGDLFIDCSGLRALLLGQALGVPFQDWSHWLPCNRAVAVQTSLVGEVPPFTRSIAHGWGWQWRIPLQHRVGNGLVYSAQALSDEQARENLLARVQGEVLSEPRFIKFTPGQREVTWLGNCVAIGLSSGFLEPLESTSIHLIQRGLIRLMQMFPSQGIRPSDVDEYNRQTREEMQHIRDFIILHYKVTERRDTEFWRYCAEMAVPDSLRHRIELFKESARVFRVPQELFAENSWIQVMLGQGIFPAQHHQVADLMGDAELTRFLNDISGQVERSVAQLPKHQDYIASYLTLPGSGA